MIMTGSICGANCEKCSFQDSCRGCAATCGRPFGGTCVAAEYTIEVGSSSELCADADVEYCFSTGLCASVAAEYIYNNMFFLRTGGHFGKGSIPSFASAGLGAKVFGASLNVAYIFASETLVGSWMLGLGYAF